MESVAESLAPGGYDALCATVFLEKRMDIPRILAAEAAKFTGGGSGVPVMVLVCGPPGMADEVRVEVSRLARNTGAVLTFVEEVFGW